MNSYDNDPNTDSGNSAPGDGDARPAGQPMPFTYNVLLSGVMVLLFVLGAWLTGAGTDIMAFMEGLSQAMDPQAKNVQTPPVPYKAFGLAFVGGISLLLVLFRIRGAFRALLGPR